MSSMDDRLREMQISLETERELSQRHRQISEDVEHQLRSLVVKMTQVSLAVQALIQLNHRYRKDGSVPAKILEKAEKTLAELLGLDSLVESEKAGFSPLEEGDTMPLKVR